MEQLVEDITKASVRLLIREPFYGHLCAMMQRKISHEESRISIAWIGQTGFLLQVNPDYWIGLGTEDRKAGAIKHQLLHLILKHPFRRDGFGNKKIFDMAADLVVNQFLQAEQLSEDAITITNLGLLPNYTLDEYYRIILQLVEEESNGKGSCCSCAGEYRKTTGPSSEHQQWNAGEENKSAMQELMMQAVDDMITNCCERVGAVETGKLPAGLSRHVQEVLQKKKPVVSWKRMIRLFAASARKTYLKSTLKRPSKRYGTIPGIRIRNRQKLLVAIDTSGSISPEELTLFFQEIHHIWKQGVEIMVVECDAEIQRTWHYAGRRTSKVAGGGGTDLTPPLQFANTMYHPDAIIYFTDGHANAPTVTCIAPVLWLITPEGISDKEWNFLPGRKIKMKPLSVS